jgi:hypothetical protein
MWSWVKNKEWYPNVQAAADAADRPCTRVQGGKVFVTPGESQLVRFGGIDFNQIHAVVVSAIIEDRSE